MNNKEFMTIQEKRLKENKMNNSKSMSAIQKGENYKNQRLKLSDLHQKQIFDFKELAGKIPANPSYIETKKRDLIYFKFDVYKKMMISKEDCILALNYFMKTKEQISQFTSIIDQGFKLAKSIDNQGLAQEFTTLSYAQFRQLLIQVREYLFYFDYAYRIFEDYKSIEDMNFNRFYELLSEEAIAQFKLDFSKVNLNKLQAKLDKNINNTLDLYELVQQMVRNRILHNKQIQSEFTEEGVDDKGIEAIKFRKTTGIVKPIMNNSSKYTMKMMEKIPYSNSKEHQAWQKKIFDEFNYEGLIHYQDLTPCCKKMFGIEKEELDTFMKIIDDAFMQTSNLDQLFKSGKQSSDEVIDANMSLEEFQLFCQLLQYKFKFISIVQKVDNAKVDAITYDNLQKLVLLKEFKELGINLPFSQLKEIFLRLDEIKKGFLYQSELTNFLFKKYLEANRNIDAKMKQQFMNRMEPNIEQMKFMQKVLLDRSAIMYLPTHTQKLTDKSLDANKKYMFETMTQQQFFKSRLDYQEDTSDRRKTQLQNMNCEGTTYPHKVIHQIPKDKEKNLDFKLHTNTNNHNQNRKQDGGRYKN